MIRANLKSSNRCIKSAATARKVMGMVRRNFSHLDIAVSDLSTKLGLYPATSGVFALFASLPLPPFPLPLEVAPLIQL